MLVAWRGHNLQDRHLRASEINIDMVNIGLDSLNSLMKLSKDPEMHCRFLLARGKLSMWASVRTRTRNDSPPATHCRVDVMIDHSGTVSLVGDLNWLDCLKHRIGLPSATEPHTYCITAHRLIKKRERFPVSDNMGGGRLGNIDLSGRTESIKCSSVQRAASVEILSQRGEPVISLISPIALVDPLPCETL